MPVRPKACLLTPSVATVAEACDDAPAMYKKSTGTAPSFIVDPPSKAEFLCSMQNRPICFKFHKNNFGRSEQQAVFFGFDLGHIHARNLLQILNRFEVAV